jgi:hypothetical protein
MVDQKTIGFFAYINFDFLAVQPEVACLGYGGLASQGDQAALKAVRSLYRSLNCDIPASSRFSSFIRRSLDAHPA